MKLRDLPSVDELLKEDRLAEEPRPLALDAARAALARAREEILAGGDPGDIVTRVQAELEVSRGARLRRTLNATGVIVHTNLGRAPLARAADYDRAVGPETALLLRVHQSNFRIVGFTEQPSVAELATVARRHGLPLVDDLGSGVLAHLEDEPSAKESLAAGADLVCFSGDKLLGGPQAGIIVGRADLVEQLRRHPLQRAVRADKLTLAALEGTLALYLDPELATREVPVLRMLQEPSDVVRARAARLAEAVGGEVEETVARVGGGGLPLAEDASFACAVGGGLAAPLRAGSGGAPGGGGGRGGRPVVGWRAVAGAGGGGA